MSEEKKNELEKTEKQNEQIEDMGQLLLNRINTSWVFAVNYIS